MRYQGIDFDIVELEPSKWRWIIYQKIASDPAIRDQTSYDTREEPLIACRQAIVEGFLRRKGAVADHPEQGPWTVPRKRRKPRPTRLPHRRPAVPSSDASRGTAFKEFRPHPLRQGRKPRPMAKRPCVCSSRSGDLTNDQTAPS